MPRQQVVQHRDGVFFSAADTAVRDALVQQLVAMGAPIMDSTKNGERSAKYPSIVWGRKDRICGCNDPLCAPAGEPQYNWLSVPEFKARVQAWLAAQNDSQSTETGVHYQSNGAVRINGQRFTFTEIRNIYENAVANKRG